MKSDGAVLLVLHRKCVIYGTGNIMKMKPAHGEPMPEVLRSMHEALKGVLNCRPAHRWTSIDGLQKLAITHAE